MYAKFHRLTVTPLFSRHLMRWMKGKLLSWSMTMIQNHFTISSCMSELTNSRGNIWNKDPQSGALVFVAKQLMEMNNHDKCGTGCLYDYPEPRESDRRHSNR